MKTGRVLATMLLMAVALARHPMATARSSFDVYGAQSIEDTLMRPEREEDGPYCEVRTIRNSLFDAQETLDRVVNVAESRELSPEAKWRELCEVRHEGVYRLLHHIQVRLLVANALVHRPYRDTLFNDDRKRLDELTRDSRDLSGFCGGTPAVTIARENYPPAQPIPAKDTAALARKARELEERTKGVLRGMHGWFAQSCEKPTMLLGRGGSGGKTTQKAPSRMPAGESAPSAEVPSN